MFWKWNTWDLDAEWVVLICLQDMGNLEREDDKAMSRRWRANFTLEKSFGDEMRDKTVKLSWVT